MPEGGVGQKIWLRVEFSFNNRKHWNAVFLGKMNSGGIARDSGGNTRDSGVNGRNDFFENTKIIFWLKWVRAEFGALGGILRFGQISWLNAFRLKLLTARRYIYIYLYHISYKHRMDLLLAILPCYFNPSCIFTPLRVGWPPTPQVYFGPWEGLRVVFPRGGSPS